MTAVSDNLHEWIEGALWDQDDPMKRRIYYMEDADWNRIENQVLDLFPAEVHSLIDWRYCFKCEKMKPPRTHHCSVCSECVMRMDHHCPWTGNCIGIKNHKYFWNFLLHAFLGNLVVVLVKVYMHGIKLIF